MPSTPRTISTYIMVKNRRLRSERTTRRLRSAWGRAGLGLGALLVLGLALGTLLVAWAYFDLSRGLPGLATLPAMFSENGALLQPTRLYDRSGEHVLLTLETPGVARRYIPVEQSAAEYLPDSLVNAILATFDPSFETHLGYSLYGIREGFHPTLAQMLVSDLLLESEPEGLRRNLRERLLAAEVTARYGRTQVLAWYLNSANFGRLAYGAEAAAQTYFGKRAAQLDLAESAMLAAAAQAPALNPFDAPGAAQQIQQRVLDQMQALGWISPVVAQQAKAEVVHLRTNLPTAVDFAPAFNRLVLSQLEELLGRDRLERGGLVIITTLDYDLQQQVGCTARTHLLRLHGNPDTVQPQDGSTCKAARLLPALPAEARDLPPDLSASAEVLDAQTGQVLALVEEAGAQREAPALANHAPGTLLTPWIYLAAFAHGYSPASLIWDIPASRPAGMEWLAAPGDEAHGPMRLRTALVNDYRIPAAQLLTQISPATVWTTALQFGLTSLQNPQSRVEAHFPFEGGRVTLVEAAQAYGVFANQGILAGQTAKEASGPSSTAVLLVDRVDGTNEVNWSRPDTQSILSAPLAYLMNQVLSDESARKPSQGFPNTLEIGRPAGVRQGDAGSSGAWTAGYTPQRVAVTWVGPAAPNSWTQQVGPGWASGLWHALIEYASQDIPVQSWSAPTGISVIEVCEPSGMLPTTVCPARVSEVFLTGNEPSGVDTLYRSVLVDRETGRLATVLTPPELVDKRVFLNVPPEAREWAKTAGVELAPEVYDAIQAPPVLPDAHFSTPGMFAAVRGQVALTGSAAGKNFSFYQVFVGQGLNPTQWVQVGADVKTPVNEGVLATWDTHDLNGLFAVRLVVMHTDQQVEGATLQVRVDNRAPSVQISYPAEQAHFQVGQVFTFQVAEDEKDLTGLERVEWWVDGVLVGTSRQAPFAWPWKAEPGKHRVQVRVFDGAGNETESKIIEYQVE